MLGGAHYAGQPEVMAKRMTAVLSSLKTWRELPHVQAVSLVRSLVWVASFDLMGCMYKCQLRILFKITPRMWAVVLRIIADEGKMRGPEVSCFVQAFVKCTKIYFSRANNALGFLAHLMQHS